jgi:signal peptidase I
MKIVGILLGVISVIGLILFVGFFIVISPRQIMGQSMYPTFQDGEYILTTSVGYKIERGSVVLYKEPVRTQIHLIHRVVGLPGEEVRITKGVVHINNEVLDESEYIPKGLLTLGGSELREDESYIIPEGHYLVLGDNRSQSKDSRYTDFVPEENIISVPIGCYWSCH